MDITPTITNTNTNTNTKSPETDTTDHHQTGATRIHSAKPLIFTNGVLKRHHPQPQQQHGGRHLHHPIVVTYKECLKNHAASLGGHALDGCGEFMPSPTTIPSDPTSLKCAACGCHRNFHRREPDQDHHAHTPTTATIEYRPHHRHHPPPPPLPQLPVSQPPQLPSQRSPSSASPPPISSSYYPSAPHMLLALSGDLQQQSSAAAAAAHQEHNNKINNNNNIMMMSNSGGRKRFRTRFSQSQKEKMFEFAERVGWKMQKRDEVFVHEFCNEVGVDRTVLKVWMHNNKNTFAKRDLNNGSNSGVNIGGGIGIGRINLHDDDNTGNTGNNNNNDSNKSGDDDDEDEDGDNINDHNNIGVQNLNHHFGSTTNGGGSSSSS